jgi:hypothetical protein
MIFLSPTLLALTEYLIAIREQHAEDLSDAGDPQLATPSPVELAKLE